MASIKDVAKACGFSVTTVSRALNGYDDVNEQTKERIREAAKKLQYTPNIHAKNLVMQKSNRIGFVVFDFGRAAGEDNFVYELMIGMQKQCLEIGYDLVFLFGSLQSSVNSDVVALMRQYDLCGLIIMGCGKDSKTYTDLLTIQKPVALIDGDVYTDYVGGVSVDNYQAALEAVQYLLETKKRKNILLINGKPDSVASRERLRGYADAVGADFSESNVFYGDYNDVKSEEIIRDIIVKRGCFPYDAVFTTSDMMAVGAERALLSHGIAVGRDVDIIGFDNIPLSAYIRVPLTTVEQDKNKLGSESVKMLVSILNKTSPERKVTVKHRLVVRDSA